jgi:hypothetical protein
VTYGSICIFFQPQSKHLLKGKKTFIGHLLCAV